MARLKNRPEALEAVEAHYKVKPIIYTGEKYYDDFLKKSFQIIYSGLLITTFIEKIEEDWLLAVYRERISARNKRKCRCQYLQW
jgi:lysozyme